MSITYPMYNYSAYPDEIDKFNRFTDLTLDTIEYANQYNTYMTRGDISGAAKILLEHPELETSLINAANLNKIIDAIKCIETFYAEDIQKYLINIIKYRSEYSSNTKYSKYDLIIYNDLGYLCISSDCPIGASPKNIDYFIPLTLRGEKGTSGLNLSFEGSWNSKITYNKDSCVVHNNSLYASITDDNLAHTPSVNSEYWTLVINFNTITSYDNSSSNLSSITMQNAIDEVNGKTNTNESNIDKNTTNIAINTKSIENINSRISKIDNTADKDKSVKYATSAGSANTATSATNANYASSAGTATTCIGNAATATHATSAGNSDTVDGFHFQLSTTDLTAGSSSLTTNTFYFVYE